MTSRKLPPNAPLLVIVAGRPGSGKSTLAQLISEELGCPVLPRDDVYGGLVRSFSTVGDLPPDLMKIAFDTFFETISLLVSRHVSIVADAAFQGPKWQLGLQPVLSKADVRVIRCEIETDVARDRVIERQKRKAQSEPDLGPDSPIVRPYEPVSLRVPTLSVSTIDGYDPAMPQIIDFIQVRDHSATVQRDTHGAQI